MWRDLNPDICTAAFELPPCSQSFYISLLIVFQLNYSSGAVDGSQLNEEREREREKWDSSSELTYFQVNSIVTHDIERITLTGGLIQRTDRHDSIQHRLCVDDESLAYLRKFQCFFYANES